MSEEDASVFKHMKLKLHLTSDACGPLPEEADPATAEELEDSKQDPDAKSTDDSDKVPTTGDVSDNSDDSEVSNPGQLMNRILNEFGISFVRDSSSCKLATCSIKLCPQQLQPIDDKSSQQSTGADETPEKDSLYYTKKFHEKFSNANRKRKLEAPGLSLNNFVKLYDANNKDGATEDFSEAIVETISASSTLNDDAASVKDSAASLAAPALGPSEATEGQPPAISEPCAVCEDKATGLHYGVMTCEGCKGFFKRTVQNRRIYDCSFDRTCDVQLQRRNNCQFCRFKKCLEKGMAVEAVRENHMPGGRNSKSVYGRFDGSTKKPRADRERAASKQKVYSEQALPPPPPPPPPPGPLLPPQLSLPPPTSSLLLPPPLLTQPPPLSAAELSRVTNSAAALAAAQVFKTPPLSMVSSSGAGGCTPISSTETTIEVAKKVVLRQAAGLNNSAMTAAVAAPVFSPTLPPPQPPLPLPPYLGSQQGAYRLMGPLHSGPRVPGPMPDPILLAPSRQYSLNGFRGKMPPSPPITTQPPGLAFQSTAPPLRRQLVPTGAYLPPGTAAIFNGFINNGAQQLPFPAFQPLQPAQQYPQSHHQKQPHPAPSRTPESDVSDPELALRLLSRGLDHPLPISIDLIREAVDKSNTMSALAECLTELEKVCLMCLFRWNKERMCESACLGPSFTNWKHIMHLSLTRHFLVTSQTLQAGMTSMSHFTYELGRRLRQFAQARQIDCTDNDGRLNNLLAESGEFFSVILDVVLSSRKDVISDFLFLLGNHTEDQIVTKVENQPKLLPALRSFRATAEALEKARPEHQVLLLASLLGLHQASEKPRVAGQTGEAEPPSSDG